jgi:tRNA A37 methylthiotransferase MiaB
MAGKKEIAAAVFSFIFDGYLTNTPTPIIKEALRKVIQLLNTLDDEKEEKQPVIVTGCNFNPAVEAPSKPNETEIVIPDVHVVSEKKQRAPRKDKGVKRPK